MNRNQASGLQSPGPRVSVDQVEPCSHLSVTSLSFPPASDAQLGLLGLRPSELQTIYQEIPSKSNVGHGTCGSQAFSSESALTYAWLPKAIRGHLPFQYATFKNNYFTN